MDELLFEIVKIVVMVVALLIARYLVPWLRQKIGAEKVAEISMWAKQAVLMAEQVYKDLTELDRPVYVLLHGDELIINPQCLAEEEAEALCDSLIMVCDKSEKGRQ